MYLTKAQRATLEATLYNLRYGADCIGRTAERLAELSAMTDTELESSINKLLADM